MASETGVRGDRQENLRFPGATPPCPLFPFGFSSAPPAQGFDPPLSDRSPLLSCDPNIATTRSKYHDPDDVVRPINPPIPRHRSDGNVRRRQVQDGASRLYEGSFHPRMDARCGALACRCRIGTFAAQSLASPLSERAPAVPAAAEGRDGQDQPKLPAPLPDRTGRNRRRASATTYRSRRVVHHWTSPSTSKPLRPSRPTSGSRSTSPPRCGSPTPGR